MVAKKPTGWGGKRVGAGRPRGSGRGPSPEARSHRVAIMVSEAELGKLQRVARRTKKPLATLAYELLAKGLRSLR